jgi:hypothetical protein
MRRVTISHCSFRHGPASPSDFLKDIPEPNRVIGWADEPTIRGKRSRAAAAA